MFITIDSNVLNLPPLIADKLTLPSKRWCTKFNRCHIIDPKSKYQVFYNTPVSMSTDPSYYEFPDDAVSFIYLDYSTNTATLKQILANIPKLNNVVVFSNADVYASGNYPLSIGNCNDQDISDVISGIMVIHLQKNRLVDEAELLAILTNSDYSDASDTQSDQKKYSVYNVLDAKRSNYGEIQNCHDCSA
ncbi:GrBNV gp81-like protein [Tomelloso virus]|uniref:GrBNV gp81-like protein n=1 Tax=Tomelloso virus TaxID=2053981 RepID=A0A2H4T2T3_9VIRU|nr:GrBNV gp81-like protein [Tomelloso virus]ATY70243.1 GrBNV gp81-like protein [Tomelloso virus]